MEDLEEQCQSSIEKVNAAQLQKAIEAMLKAHLWDMFKAVDLLTRFSPV